MSDFLLHLRDGGLLKDSLPTLDQPINHIPEMLKQHATTVVGVRYKGGVLLGSDSQITNAGLNRLSEPICKIFVVNTNAILGIAGAGGIAQSAAQLFQVTCEAEQCLAGIDSKPLSKEQYGLILRSIAKQGFSLAVQSNGALAALFILAVYDDNRPYVVYADPGGMILPYDQSGYASIGSGSSQAESFLRNIKYNPETSSFRQALKAIIGALNDAATVNKATAEPFFVGCSDSEGTRLLDEALISATLRKVRGE